MDHSIFGNLIVVNSNGESYSNEELYIDEQSSSCDPESSSNNRIGSYTEENDNSSGSIGKKKGRPKKMTGKFKELRFQCQQCDYKTWKKSNFQRHLGTHNRKLYRCTLCPFSGKHADDLQQHIVCHKKKDTTENIDVNRFAFVQKLIKADPIRIIPKNHSDDIIKKEVKSEPTDVKVEERPVACSTPIEVDMDDQSNSDSMIAESSMDDDYDSDAIPSTIKIDPVLSNQLKRNSLTVTPIVTSVGILSVDRPSTMQRCKELRFSCPYCSYRTWKTSNFQRHLCTHTTERPYKCHLCKYSGKHHEDLKKHMVCHANKCAPTMYIANNETAVIPINPAIVAANRVLVNNENEPDQQSLLGNNINAKRFTCLLCDFETNRSSALTRHHYVVHNDNRPFACDLCPYRTKLRDSLKKHMMSHTDERPFECEICHHRCRQKGDLKRHELLHTGDRPFACPHCPYRSNRTQLLKKHISRRHNIPHISPEITVTKTISYEDFGKHYLAGMF